MKKFHLPAPLAILAIPIIQKNAVCGYVHVRKDVCCGGRLVVPYSRLLSFFYRSFLVAENIVGGSTSSLFTRIPLGCREAVICIIEATSRSSLVRFFSCDFTKKETYIHSEKKSRGSLNENFRHNFEYALSSLAT